MRKPTHKPEGRIGGRLSAPPYDIHRAAANWDFLRQRLCLHKFTPENAIFDEIGRHP